MAIVYSGTGQHRNSPPVDRLLLVAGTPTAPLGASARSGSMRTVQQVLADVGLPSSLTRRGDYTIICPRCSAKRVKKDAICLSVKVDHHGVVWRCHHCGWSGGAQYRSRQDKEVPTRSATASTSSSYDRERKRQSAVRIWRESVPLPGTLGEQYFIERRKLDVRELGDLSHALQWHSSDRMIVALMTDPQTNEPLGVHRTFLDRSGAKLERKMLGPAGVIRLSPDDAVTTGLGIVEGIEDGLAPLLDHWAPIWVACSARGIRKFPALRGIDALTIFADADQEGQEAATACAAQWRRAGHEVTIRPPIRASHD